MTNNPASQSTESRQQPGNPRTVSQKLKLTLIVECGLHPWTGTGVDSLIAELGSFIQPAQAELSLIYACPDLLTDLHHLPETENLEACLRERHKTHEDTITKLRRDIEVAGFEIISEQQFPITADSQQNILDYLKDSGQELMALCGHHAAGSHLGRDHFLMNLTSHASIPTLLLKRKLSRTGGALQVLFGIDASEASLTAARQLGQILPPEQVALTLATVQSPAFQENAVLAPYVNQEILTEALEANAGILFEMFTDLLKPQGFTVADFKVLIGSPASELGYLAEADHPDLIVVGSHNQKGFLAWVMGSVSSQLVHWDTHNILVVR